jgi:hypothetical protein
MSFESVWSDVLIINQKLKILFLIHSFCESCEPKDLSSLTETAQRGQHISFGRFEKNSGIDRSRCVDSGSVLGIEIPSVEKK